MTDIRLKNRKSREQEDAVEFLYILLADHGFRADRSEIALAWGDWSQANEAVSWADPHVSGRFDDKSEKAVAVEVGRFVERYFEEFNT